MNSVLSFAVGLIFGLGLIVSGMGNPAKVLAFLDLAGDWDPSLIIVMAAAVAVSALAYRLARHRGVALLGQPINWPTGSRINTRLIAGSALFGVGWGLAGICPGPALVLLGAGTAKGMVFVLALLAGMGLFEFIDRRGESLR